MVVIFSFWQGDRQKSEKWRLLSLIVIFRCAHLYVNLLQFAGLRIFVG